MSTIFILLDGFRKDYLSNSTTPFLWKCSQEGEHYESVEPSFGFCERTEILTGMRGDESGFFSAIGYDPANSPYSGKNILSFFHFIEKLLLYFLKFTPKSFGSKVHKRLRYYADIYFSYKGIKMPSFLVPYTWLKYFSLTEDRVDLRQPGAFSKPSIFTLLEKNKKNYFYDSFTALGLKTPYDSDQARLDSVVEDLANNKKDLYLIYVSAPDVYGHIYGPETHDCRVFLNKMDKMLERFTTQIKKIDNKNTFIFVGDHGMLTVTSHFDAEKELKTYFKKTGLKSGKDVIYFLDSTMVRLWAISDRAYQILPGIVKTVSGFSDNGKWMDNKIANRYHVPWPDRRYGDFLWIAKSGVMVFPDFFHRLKPYKGMHGYDPKLPESNGKCIVWGEGIQSKNFPLIPLTGVYSILKKALKL